MPIFSYCYVSIFGSGLDAEELKAAIGEPNATVVKVGRNKPSEPRSPVPALRTGNVWEWNSPYEYYVQPTEIRDTVVWDDYLIEEEHIIRCLQRWMPIRKVLPQFQTETTEIWLHLIYRARADERPAGVFFSRGLLDAAHELGVSISTDVAFDG